MIQVTQLGKINTLAAQLRRHDMKLDRSGSYKLAHKIIRETPTASLLIFNKKDGTLARRVVDVNWRLHYTPKGSTKKVAPGLQIFADLARVATKPSYPIISAYKSNIQLLAA